MKHTPAQLRIAGFFLAGIIMLCDQLSKKWIIAAANAAKLPVVVTSFFNITLIFNKGISFGMFAHSDSMFLFMLPVGLGIITFMLCLWLVKAEALTVILALGLIIGGAVGNLVDRVHGGVVTDFLDFHIGQYHWPAFNFADSSIFIGVVLFVITNIIQAEKPGEVSK